MEYNISIFDTARRAMRKVRPLYRFITLILAVLLFYVVLLRLGILSSDDISGIIYDLNYLASILLKIAVAYFVVEAVGFLHGIQKRQPHNSAEKKGNKQQPVPVSSTSTKQDQRSASMGSPTSRVSSCSSRQQDEPVTYCRPKIDIPLGEGAGGNWKKECAAPVVSRQHKWQPSSKVQFDFYNRERALVSIDCKRQDSVYLVQVDKGDLEGSEVEQGVFYVSPVEKYLTESVLRYSTVTVCFEITGTVQPKVSVRCDKPAILHKLENGLYEVVKKGKLTIISAIE